MSEKITTSQPGTIEALKPDNKNFNKHTEYGMALLEKSLRQNGAGRSILVDKDDNIIAGNGIVEAAQNAGITKTRVVEVTGDELVVVKRTDLALDSKQGREMALADNATAAADLEWDTEAIADVSAEFDIDVSDWGVFVDDATEDGHKTATEDDFDETTDAVAPLCKKGDIWQLGNHRLMCGDSTNADDVAMLMDGEKADIAFYSPPYNAGFGKNITKDNGRSKYTNGSDDNLNATEYAEFLSKVIDNATEYAEFNFLNIQYLANNKIALVKTIADKVNILADIMIWDKAHSQPQLAANVLNSQFEFVFVFSKKGNRNIGKRKFHGTLANIIQIPPQRNEYSEIHNAVFPIALASHFVDNFSEKSVLDLFGGTGTTMVACEQLNRKCFMMELDEHYCDVIIARWEKLTGQKAEILTNGE